MLNTSKATPKYCAANYGIDVSALVQAFRNEKTNTFITSEDDTPRVE